MDSESKAVSSRVVIGGVVAVALVALLAGFLLGRSGSQSVSDPTAAGDLTIADESEVSGESTTEPTANGEPPEALPLLDDQAEEPTESATSSTTTPSTETPAPAQSTQAPATSASTEATAPAQSTQAPATTAAPIVEATAGVQLFVDTTNSAAQWAANNSTDSRSATIANEIGSQPIARWFGDWNGNVGSDVASYVDRANAANAVPTLVAYNIPDRDCGQHSSGGAANFDQYDAWITSFASGLGNSEAIIILEPDALALNGCAGSDRNRAINDAVNTIKASCSQCSVYLDAGHSNWVVPADMANRLLDAGVMDADGFFTNVSNYNATDLEQAFGTQVLDALGNPADLAQVIDTSRNGNGANGEWCDAPGRSIGPDPTLQTGTATVDAYLWVKVPGEADGCIAGAGQFVPDRAFELANG